MTRIDKFLSSLFQLAKRDAVPSECLQVLTFSRVAGLVPSQARLALMSQMIVKRCSMTDLDLFINTVVDHRPTELSYLHRHSAYSDKRKLL